MQASVRHPGRRVKETDDYGPGCGYKRGGPVAHPKAMGDGRYREKKGAGNTALGHSDTQQRA